MIQRKNSFYYTLILCFCLCSSLLFAMKPKPRSPSSMERVKRLFREYISAKFPYIQKRYFSSQSSQKQPLASPQKSSTAYSAAKQRRIKQLPPIISSGSNKSTLSKYYMLSAKNNDKIKDAQKNTSTTKKQAYYWYIPQVKWFKQ